MHLRLIAASVALALAAPVYAQQPSAQQPAAAQEPQDPDHPIAFEEQLVVTASRTDQQLVNAPASVSLITTETIQNSPGTNIGDLLRAVPGINVTQLSARDVNLTARGATSTLATSQLALVDGRSVYLDFFGMVMWDLVPTNANEIKQIEVIRGPASAVWGANAMSGVVNVITLSPRELAASGGSSLTIGAGFFDRDVTGQDNGTGGLFYVNGTHAQAVNDKWSVQAVRGVLLAGRAAAPHRHDTEFIQHAVPTVQQQRYVAAEVRRPRRLRAGEFRKARVLRWCRRHRGHHSQRHRPLRHQ